MFKETNMKKLEIHPFSTTKKPMTFWKEKQPTFSTAKCVWKYPKRLGELSNAPNAT